jgi:hypothetical protein
MPWLWGINGATSVLASVLAVVIAMAVSISASFWTGVACYAVAFLAFLRAGQEKNQRLLCFPTTVCRFHDSRITVRPIRRLSTDYLSMSFTCSDKNISPRPIYMLNLFMA